MNIKSLSKIITLGLLLLTVSCSEDHTYYQTAASAAITGLAEEYEAGEAIMFTCDVVPTQGATITNYLWEFGDPDNTTSTDSSPVFTYTKDGTFTVKLTVTDSNNLKTQKTQKITITNPTKANFTLAKDEYMYGDEVQFYDASVTKGSTTITGWLWEFADSDNSTSTEQNPKFTYKVAGSYPVKLTVTDSYGLKASITKSVNVIDPTMIIQMQWTAALGGAIKGGSSPALSADGSVVYMLRSTSGSDKAQLHAYNSADGVALWTMDISEAMAQSTPVTDVTATAAATDVFCSPSVGPDGSIYMIVRDLQSGTRVGPVTIAANSNGKVKWARANGATGTNLYAVTPAIDSNGNIIVATRGNEMWVYDSNGNINILSTGTLGITAGISVSKNGVAYASANGANGFFATNIATGSQMWVYNKDFAAAPDAFTGALRSAQSSIDTDGTLYLVSDATGGGGQIIAIDPNTGNSKWVYKTLGAIPDGGVIIANDGTLYANGGTSADQGLIALNHDGTFKWSYATKAIVQTSPLVDDRGYVHIVDAQGNYYVITDQGILYAETNLGGTCTSTPVMDNKGRLYVAIVKDGVATMVCATSKASSYSTDAPWPMKGQNPCRTGLQK